MSTNDYEEIFIAPKHFEKKFAKFDNQRLKSTIKASSFLSGLYLVMGGIVALGGLGMGYFLGRDGQFAFDLAAFALLGGFIMIMAPAIKKNAARMRIELAKREEYLASEAKKLEKLRDQMSPAEWANYKLQMENQRLLHEMNNRTMKQKSNSSSSTSYEITTEF